MPYTAYTPDDEDIHFVSQADAKTAYQCIDCHEPVQLVSAHERSLSGGGSTTVSSHFRYSNCSHGTVNDPSLKSPGGGGGGGGESERHKRRKRAALQEALNRFPSSDYGTEVKIGNKRADAVLNFDDPHNKYGKGLVIEYQHKNEGKDIKDTQVHFAKNEYTTVWLWDEQFTFTSSIPEIDLFGGSVYTPWPDAVPSQDRWRGKGLSQEQHEKWRHAHKNGLTESVVQANILKHWVVPTPAEHWRQSAWEDRFRDIQTESTHDYRAQATLTPTSTSLRIHASIKRHWVVPTPTEYWEKSDWDARFRNTVSESADDHLVQASIPRISPTSSDSVYLPPNVVDGLLYQYAPWYTLFEMRKDNYYALSCVMGDQSIEEMRSTEIEIDFAPLFDIDFWLKAYREGVEKAQKIREKTVDRPNTVFHDVQCHNCENFQYAESAGPRCPNCGSEYDWLWNLSTGRVSGKSLPDFVNNDSLQA